MCVCVGDREMCDSGGEGGAGHRDHPIGRGRLCNHFQLKPDMMWSCLLSSPSVYCTKTSPVAQNTFIHVYTCRYKNEQVQQFVMYTGNLCLIHASSAHVNIYIEVLFVDATTLLQYMHMHA